MAAPSSHWACRKRSCATARSSTFTSARSMLLEIKDLTVGYGGAPAIWDVALNVEEREIVSVIGPNGAGKSTLINTIAGLLRPERGTLRLGKVDLGKVAPHLVCRHGVALVPEGRRLFAGMTV